MFGYPETYVSLGLICHRWQMYRLWWMFLTLDHTVFIRLFKLNWSKCPCVLFLSSVVRRPYISLSVPSTFSQSVCKLFTIPCFSPITTGILIKLDKAHHWKKETKVISNKGQHNFPIRDQNKNRKINTFMTLKNIFSNNYSPCSN